MNRTTARPRTTRIAAAAAAALLVPLVALGGGAAAWAVDEPAPAPTAAGEEVTGGSFSWGVRTSIRNYLEQHGHTEGWVQGYDGVSYKKGDSAAVFPVTGGTVDPTAGTASIELGGTLEMQGFGEPWLHFTDLRLDVADGTATLTVDMIESYNVKTRTDDIVLSTFAVPAGGLAIDDEELSFTTERGKFSETVAVEHLPSYGGPTYAAPNDYTDPMTLQLNFGEEQDPGTDPGTNPDPGTGPYGTSIGTAYSDSRATIRITPGYALNADGETQVKVEGFGFDPGTAAAPYNVYVGLGAMSDPAQPEKWRRSKGGSSGALGQADFDYGSVRLVVSHHSPDSDVADGVIDANGNWQFTMTVPNKDVPSFFGGTIDCVANLCGVFSFGAHGAVRASNEAFAPVFFTGQDESSWPDREDDDPTPVDPGDGGDDDGDPGDQDPGERPGEKDCEPNGSNSTTNAAGAVLTVSPAKCLGDENQTLKVSGKGYPTSRGGNNFGGVYVLFGWVDRSVDNWGPANGGVGGTTYMYAKDGTPAGTFQKMVNFPGNTTGEGMPTMNAAGDWEIDLPVESSQFMSAQGKQIDCYQVTCGVITLGAHGAALADGEAFTPVYFTGDPAQTGDDKPTDTNPGGIAPNPNANNPATPGGLQNAGAQVNGGVLAELGADSDARALLILGVLLLSGGLFAAALLRLGRPVPVTG